ncbi:class I SAM-dependent methyltransferase [Rhizobacter fulvus]
MSDERELDAVAGRYARRGGPDRYAASRPDTWQSMQERQRALLRLFDRLGFDDLGALRLLEVGSGGGWNLLELLRLGFAPEHLSGAELLPERVAMARRLLPPGVTLFEGDALRMAVEPGSQDVVFASTVFSSLLDDAFQQLLADAMWRWVRPGGGVLWYDFTIDNPRNPDVRGMPLERVRALFPHGELQSRRVTLAPPIARAVTRVHPALYTLFNLLLPLRTHVLAWIAKPR